MLRENTWLKMLTINGIFVSQLRQEFSFPLFKQDLFACTKGILILDEPVLVILSMPKWGPNRRIFIKKIETTITQY